MLNVRQHFKSKQAKPAKGRTRPGAKAILATIGLASLVTGCSHTITVFDNTANAQGLPSSTPTFTPSPTLTPTPVPPTATPTWTSTPTKTPWPTPTSWPTPTPWPTLAAWAPVQPALPTLAPLPVVPTTTTVAPVGSLPVGYSPPDGVDVFGNTILRWTYYGELAEDEFFDIKIKPVGSPDSAFVDWTKSTEYELRPWPGWTPGLYTWQIGIIKGYLEGDTKHFIADTGRDSEPFLIKWQAAGGGGGGGGGGTAGGGGGGSGNSSGGS